MQGYRDVVVKLHSFLTSALDGGKWWSSRADRLTADEEIGYPLNRKLGNAAKAVCKIWKTGGKVAEVSKLHSHRSVKRETRTDC
jgi:hypothetical protein